MSDLQIYIIGQPLALKKFDLSLLELNPKITMIAKRETGRRWIGFDLLKEFNLSSLSNSKILIISNDLLKIKFIGKSILDNDFIPSKIVILNTNHTDINQQKFLDEYDYIFLLKENSDIIKKNIYEHEQYDNIFGSFDYFNSFFVKHECMVINNSVKSNYICEKIFYF